MQRRLLVFVGCLVVAACGGGSSGPPRCVPGQSVACVGPGPCNGNQVCMPNGTYAACMCGGSGTGGVTGGGGRGGGNAIGFGGLFGTGGTSATAGSSGTVGAGGSTATGTGGAGGSAAGAAGRGGSTATAGTVGTGGGAAGTTGAAGAAGTTGAAGAAGSVGGATAGSGAGGSGGAGTGGTAGSTLVCNPVAQTGCNGSERCTWVITGTNTGHAACRADGSVNVGGACSYGAPGETTGVDNCRKGTSCLSGICKTICSTTPDSCPTNFACDVYTGAPFDPGNTMGIGFCDPTCNPVTQARSDGAAACGSANPSAPTLGCYGPVGGKFVCAPVVAPTKTQGMTIPTPFVNACAPGFMPTPQTSATNSPAICTAFCRPADTSSASPAGAAGLAGSGYTCPDRGAASPHECRYWWNWFENYAAANYQLTPYSNTVGFCLNYPNYQFDSNNDRVLDMVYPSCTALSPTAHTYDPVLTDASAWGCLAHP